MDQALFWHFVCVNSFHPHKTVWHGTPFISILQIKQVASQLGTLGSKGHSESYMEI